MVAAAPFIGRAAELATLERKYRSEHSELIVLYGRRRVGKSELILKFMEGKPGLYYLGKQIRGPLQIRQFLKVLARTVREPLLEGLGGGAEDAWLELLLGAVRQLAARHHGKKVILALDEFQYMVEASPGLVSILQECWDRHWKDSGQVLVVVCGSHIGFMERVLAKPSPLFGRRTAQIVLPPFDFLEAAKFHPNYSTVDRARTYFVCGGIPLYLRSFDRGKSVDMNIVENFLDPHATLFQEAEFLLREELRELVNYHAVLMSLGEQRSLPGHVIGERTGLGMKVQYYLEQLLALRYVARRAPLTKRARPNKREIRWTLDDPLLRFWFRFVYPNTSFLKPGKGWDFFRETLHLELDAYFGEGFERLCREALPLVHEQEGVRSGARVGEFWAKDVQIDVVGLRNDGIVDLGECKWGPVRSGSSLRRELEAKVPRYPAGDATILRRLFTRAARPRGPLPPEVRWHTLEDLYQLR